MTARGSPQQMTRDADAPTAQRPDGSLARSPALHQTIEELANALDGARQSEARLRNFVDTIPALAWCNLPDGANEFLNRRWHDYTGLSPEAAREWGWQVAIHPQDLPR